MARERIEARPTKIGPSVFTVTGYTRVVSKVWDALLAYKDMYYVRLKYDRKLRQYVKIDTNYPPIKTLSLD
jgi:hypothetical protein